MTKHQKASKKVRIEIKKKNSYRKSNNNIQKAINKIKK